MTESLGTNARCHLSNIKLKSGGRAERCNLLTYEMLMYTFALLLAKMECDYSPEI